MDESGLRKHALMPGSPIAGHSDAAQIELRGRRQLLKRLITIEEVVEKRRAQRTALKATRT